MVIDDKGGEENRLKLQGGELDRILEL